MPKLIFTAPKVRASLIRLGHQSRIMEKQLKDIRDIEDIKLLVNSFYDKVNSDPLLSPIFNEIAKVDWATHLPKMYEFWNMIIFGSRDYNGSPMGVHMKLSTQTTMGKEQFDRWKFLFFKTVDELFLGTNAEEAKSRAEAVAATMMFKIKKFSGG